MLRSCTGRSRETDDGQLADKVTMVPRVCNVGHGTTIAPAYNTRVPMEGIVKVGGSE